MTIYEYLQISKTDCEAILHVIKWEYTTFHIPKKSGGKRSITAPSPRLKEIQRAIYTKLLVLGPTHVSSQGFETHKSPKTNALWHLSKKAAIVFTTDIESFFPSITLINVIKILTRIVRKYGIEKDLFTAETEDIRILAKLCTLNNALPQGSPASPRIANLLMYKVDSTLYEYCKSIGGVYTRYADDITISHPDPTISMSILHEVVRSVLVQKSSVGFTLSEKKTRVLRQHNRMSVTGVNINDKLGVPKWKYKNLRAELHNILIGESQLSPKRMQQLRGKIEWVRHLNKDKGEKLLSTFEQISI